MLAKRYHPSLVALHWLLALMLIGLLAAGTLSLKQVPNTSPDKLLLLRMHMLGGGMVLLLMLVRLVLRWGTTRPPPAPTGSALLDALAPLMHGALYLLVFAMLASGIGTAALADLPAIVFGGTGSLPDSFAALAPRQAHGVLAKLLILAIALHALAALYHQFIRRDGLIARMWWGQRY